MVKYEKSVSFSIEAHKLNYILTAPDDIKSGEKLPLIVFFNNYTGGVFDIKMFRASYAFAIIATQLHAIQKYARSNQ